MDITIEDRWSAFVQDAVSSGKYGSATDLVETALRLVQEQEGRLQSLRDTIQASLDEGGEYTSEEVAAYLDGVAEESAQEEV